MARNIWIGTNMSTRKVSGGKGSPGMAGGTYIKPAAKPVSKGSKKVTRRVENINETSDYRTGGAFGYKYKKGKLAEVVENAGTQKVKPRNLGKVLKKMAPSNKAEVKKYKETYTGSGPFKTPKVPVKKKSK